MIPELAEIEEELIIEVLVESPLMMEVRVLTAEERALLFKKLAVVVAIRPLMMEVRVKELVDVETESVFEVEDATRLVRSVVVAIPLIVVERVAPEVEIPLLVITDVVAVRPLIVVERILPVTDWEKELMIEARVPATPLTIVWKRLAEDDAVLEVMILEVPRDPPMFEESVLVATVRELEVERLVMVAFVVVELPTITLVRFASVATREEMKELVVVAFEVMRLVTEVEASVDWPVTERVPLDVREDVAVILPPVKVLTVAVTALRRVAKKLEDVAFVVVRLDKIEFVLYKVVAVKAEDDAFPRDDVPEIRVEKVPVVKLGLGVREMVEVEEKRTLAPAIKYDTGEL